jgi:sphingomyelin synthase-related protein 1
LNVLAQTASVFSRFIRHGKLLCCPARVVRLHAQSTHGCGDLIFSSHTTFMLVGMLTYTEYGTLTPIKVRATGSMHSACIVAPVEHPLCRKHAQQWDNRLAPQPNIHATLQALAWAAVAWVSVLIVASRKHYTVDVLIAW